MSNQTHDANCTIPGNRIGRGRAKARVHHESETAAKPASASGIFTNAEKKGLSSVSNHTMDTNHTITRVRIGRGRGRGTLRRQTEEASKPASASQSGILTNSEKISMSSAARHTDAKPGQVEDGSLPPPECPNKEKYSLDTGRKPFKRFESPVVNRSLSDCPKKEMRSSNATSTALREKSIVADRENTHGRSPQPSQRQFNTLVLSQINNILKQRLKEDSDSIPPLSQSRDRTGRERSSSKKLSEPLCIDIPTDDLARSERMPFSIHSENLLPDPRRLLIEGWPCNLTEPSSLLPSLEVSSSTSATKSKGQGFARGRARKKRPEMEVTSRPGAASEDNLSKSYKEKIVRGSEQFADAIQGTADSNGRHSQNTRTSNIPQSSGQQNPGSSNSSAPVSVGQNDSSTKGRSSTGSDSKPAVPGESDSPPNGDSASSKHCKSKGLSLTIGAGENSEAEGASGGYSAAPDYYTCLLSPNHECVPDWAAHMASPDPDTASNNPPNWNA